MKKRYTVRLLVVDLNERLLLMRLHPGPGSTGPGYGAL
jgi:hypothetical protein